MGARQQLQGCLVRRLLRHDALENARGLGGPGHREGELRPLELGMQVEPRHGR
jgi:hypothetical protein